MLKVLIVDHDAANRSGLSKGADWAAMDCTVVGEAGNGIEALEAVHRLRPELIITEVEMPQMDGIEMLARLRERGWQGYAILLTTRDDFTTVRSALRLGAEDYLLKPFRSWELVSALSRIRRRHGTELWQPMPGKPVPGTGYVGQTMDYIARHYADERISIAVIAAHLGVSEGHLSHVFKKEIGSTVISYLTEYRIQTAVKLLQSGKYRVYEVAHLVGYRDVSYFGSIFRKYTGVSPSECLEGKKIEQFAQK